MTEPVSPPRVNAATLLARQHEERMAAITKPGREDRPTVGAKRSTAAGSLGVMAIDVAVPVCEEFPTLALATAALVETMDGLCAHWPMPDGYVRAK